MRFDAEHRFSGNPEQVAAVLGDPTFYEQLVLPDLSLDRVVEHTRDEQGARVLLRYEYTGHLDPVALKLLGGDRLTWTQEVTVDAQGKGTLKFLAEANPDVLHGNASFDLEPDGTGTVRRLTGELVVALPIIGGMAERRIVPGVLARLEIEADAVDRRLAGG